MPSPRRKKIQDEKYILRRKNKDAFDAAKEAIVRAAMARKNHDGTWSHSGPRVEILDMACDKLNKLVAVNVLDYLTKEI